jgi:hypothetical protein
MTYTQKEVIAFAMILGLIITVGTATALAVSGVDIPNEFRIGFVVYTVLVSFIATAVFGRDN